MRVLMTTDTVGGVWTFTRELTEELLSQGCSVMLLSLGRYPSADQSAWANRIARQWSEQFRLLPTTYALEWMQENAGFYAQSLELLEHAAAEFRADILHSNQLCYGTFAGHLATLVTVHSDVRSWFAASRGREPDPSAWIDHYDHLVKRGLRAANAVVAPTAWMLSEAQQHYGPFRKVAVIPNGREVQPTSVSPAREKQAVTAGRLWDEAKGLSIFSEVSSPMPLLVAGEHTGPDVSTPVPANHVQWLGQLAETELLDLFRRSAVYVITSLYEPFGLAPLEAALCGGALVARDISSLREVWGDTAIYFRNAAELSEIFRALHHDDDLVRTMGQRATERARQCFGRQQMTERYLELYRAPVHDRTGTTLTERHVA